MKTQRQIELEALQRLTQVKRFSRLDESGVLLSDRIEGYVNEFELISPFDEELLKPAAYELRVGEQYAIGGVTRRLSSAIGQSELTIQPFEVAIIQTMERLNMPNFLIARWNIRVGLAYKGLMWVGGAQVDPGYQGFLLCPVYNLSDAPVTLNYGDPLAAIDFVTTTTPVKGRSQEYKKPEKRTRLVFADYNPHLESALATLFYKKLQQFDSELDALKNRVDQFVAVLFTAIAIIVAAIAVIAVKPPTDNAPLETWLFTALSTFATLASITCLIGLRATSSTRKRANALEPWIGIPLFLLFLFVVLLYFAAGMTFSVDDRLRKVEAANSQASAEIQKLRSELQATRH